MLCRDDSGYDAEGGKYELDGETRLLAEAIVSDRVIRHSIKEGQVFGYDEVHKLFDLENMEYDPDRLFNRSYTPSMRIHQGQKVNNEPSKNTTKYNSEYDRLRQEILLRDDMTKEDKKLMLEALNDAFNMETDPNDEMDIV